MKAIQFEAFGDADVLFLAEIPDPEPRENDLIVRVAGIGVNRADITHRKGGYGRAFFGDSDVMGLEISGTVIATGPAVAGFHRGDRVMGIVGGGAYAELARLDYRLALRVPGQVDLVGAAAIPESFVTAHEALIHLGELSPGDTALIHAAGGGIGTAAVKLAREVGATVIATASARKKAQVLQLGADVVIDYEKEDFLEIADKLSGGKGVDVVIDFLGAPNLERNVRSLGKGGRLVQVGLMRGAGAGALPMDQLLFKHLKILGTVMKSRPIEVKQAMTHRFAERWLHSFASGELKPTVDKVFPLAHAAQAHRYMESGAAFGKILLLP